MREQAFPAPFSSSSWLEQVRDRSWWRVPDSAAAREAVDRLWRHSVATALVAARLARDSEQTGLDASRLARLALLHRLADWSLAARAPDTLAQLDEIRSAKARRQAQCAVLGRAALTFEHGEALGLPASTAELLWLTAEPHLATPNWFDDARSLALLRHARSWADRSPWAPDRQPRLRPTSRRLRALVDEVQAVCGPTFWEPAAFPREEELTRRHARLLLDHDRLDALARSRSDVLARIAALDLDRVTMTDDPASVEALESCRALVRDRTHLQRLVDHLLSHLRRLQAQKSRCHQQARLDALAEFAAGAGHELNNPLAVIMGRAQLLIGQTNGPEVHRGLRTIVAQAQRTHRILRDLMYVARPAAPRPRCFNPDVILVDVARDLAREADARGVRLLARVPDSLAAAWVDPDALRQLAEALTRNALEASGSGQTVTLTGRSSARRLVWRVDDQGSGLSRRSGRHLLDPFYCGRDAGRGLGLGLSRASRFVTRAGGRLDWRSRPGRGTTFRVRIPLDPVPESEITPASTLRDGSQPLRATG